MTRSRKQQASNERDPWDEEDSAPDPWEVEEPKPAPKTPARIVPPKDEEDQMLTRRGDEDEWIVQYPIGKMATTSRGFRMQESHRKFLSTLAQTGSTKKAAIACGLTYRALTLAKQKFKDFSDNWEMAKEIYLMFHAEETLRQRVIDGTLEPITYQGRVTGYKRTYDSGLTQFWFKSNMRDKYGDQSEVKISGNINHGVAILPSRSTSMEEWEAQATKTLERQRENIIDITPTVVDTKASPVQNSGQKKIER